MLIDIDRGNGIESVEAETLSGPYFRVTETDDFKQIATLYHLNGRVVHESAHVEIKRGQESTTAIGEFA
jgi:hypothetical protein